MTRHADPHDPHLHETRAYYDDFATRYEDRRGGNDPGGYHDLIDDLEIDFVRRFGTGGDVLEVGCGTGLLLARAAEFAKTAVGVDLSPGMLERARARGLNVVEASATALPFPDNQFDVAYSFKVLAHVRDIDKALAEMARVVKPGGFFLAELYNPHSLRGLLKRLGPPGKVSDSKDESHVYTRFDSPDRAQAYAPPGTQFVVARGVRIVTPAAAALRIPYVGNLLRRAEWVLCDSPLRRFGGFWIGAFRKEGRGA
ncbi:MAG: methyltransferase domain-containing protein [Polyangiaceae bacterium]|nr:methyltransferase domain-containing protein [Polyangiaceae bacterium]